eukprot:237670-Prymnesium_polylepis.1
MSDRRSSDAGAAPHDRRNSNSMAAPPPLSARESSNSIGSARRMSGANVGSGSCSGAQTARPAVRLCGAARDSIFAEDTLQGVYEPPPPEPREPSSFEKAAVKRSASRLRAALEGRVQARRQAEKGGGDRKYSTLQGPLPERFSRTPLASTKPA